MKKIIFIFSILLAYSFVFNPSQHKLYAVEYPIISIGLNGGYGQSDLANGGFGRAFFRYSLEAYVPGFQIDIGYGAGFYQALDDTVILNPDPESLTIKTGVGNHYPMITTAFHFRPFGGGTTLYFGGGAQFHFLSVSQKTTERYWDPVAEKYQERDLDELSVLDKTAFGYHFLGGVRFELGKIGSLDLEVRQMMLDVTDEDWEDQQAKEIWGQKSWDNFSVNAGLTVYIF